MISPRVLVRLAFLAAGTLLAGAGPLLAQCAMCGEALANADKSGGGDPALGFSWGILVLLGFVACLATGLGGFIAYAARGAAGSGGQPPDAAR
jgi:hypothetical protein